MQTIIRVVAAGHCPRNEQQPGLASPNVGNAFEQAGQTQELHHASANLCRQRLQPSGDWVIICLDPSLVVLLSMQGTTPWLTFSAAAHNRIKDK